MTTISNAQIEALRSDKRMTRFSLAAGTTVYVPAIPVRDVSAVGWYECTDGRWALYDYQDAWGSFGQIAVVDSVELRDYRELAESRDRIADEVYSSLGGRTGGGDDGPVALQPHLWERALREGYARRRFERTVFTVFDHESSSI